MALFQNLIRQRERGREVAAVRRPQLLPIEEATLVLGVRNFSGVAK